MNFDPLNLVCLENMLPAFSSVRDYRQNPRHTLRSLCQQESVYMAGSVCSRDVVTEDVQEILAEWMCQVSVLREPEVFSQAISLASRYFGVKEISSRLEVQLVGAACLLSASKVVEAHSMTLEEAAYYTDDAYTRDAIQLQETTLLLALRFDVLAVVPAHFLDSLLAVASLNVTDEERQCIKKEAMRRCNICLILPEFTTCLPSIVAAAGLLAALCERNYDVNGDLSRILAQEIGCDQNELLVLVSKSFLAWQKHAPQVYDVALPKVEAEPEIHCDEEMDTSPNDEGISSDGMDLGSKLTGQFIASSLYRSEDSDSGIGFSQDEDEFEMTGRHYRNGLAVECFFDDE